MSKLNIVEGNALPLPIENLNTDQIMPKQFLHGIDKSGLDKGLLYDMRFDSKGNPRSHSILNDPRYRGASILLGGANFGCGSSREHAVWGLVQYGFAAVIAPSFAEIFYGNAMNNRLLLVPLSPAQVDELVRDANTDPHARLHIDIERQQLIVRDLVALAVAFERLFLLHVANGVRDIDAFRIVEGAGPVADRHDCTPFSLEHLRRH